MAQNGTLATIPLDLKRNKYSMHLLNTASKSTCVVVATGSKEATARVRNSAYHYAKAHSFKITTRDDGSRLRIYRIS